MTKDLFKKSLLIIALFIFSVVAYSQEKDSVKVVSHIGGAVTVTNNGISFIPNFTLGKPAAIFDLNIGKGKFSFEPQFRFALEGKPWSFIFWFRYKLLQSDKFKINIGAHPALSFKTITYTSDSVLKQSTIAQRYVAGELVPNYFFTKNISLGAYIFYSYGIEKDVPTNNTMLALRLNFSKIPVTKEIYLKFNPQVYYLRMDKLAGTYFSAALTLAKNEFPFTISSIINTPIHTTIPANNGFLWNISLIYTFNNNFIQKN